MKSRVLGPCSLALVLAVLSGCSQRASKSDAETPIAAQAQKPVELARASDADALPDNPSDAAFRRLDTEQALPAGLNLSPAVSEILKLATAGVKEDVLLAYVDRSDSTFTLGADEIIYLNDLGVPSAVVSAMIKRDAVLRNAATTADESAATSELSPAVSKSLSAQQSSKSASPAVSELAESDSVFRDALSPYGRWVEIDGYGECWIPAVETTDPNWQPYFDAGHWEYVDAGWYWLSDYSWGWAPFHYGRWFHHRYLGWCWEPDPVWGPAWVSWRYTDEYCGWAPLPPAAKYTKATGLVVNGRTVGADFTFGLNADSYAFIPFSHFRDHQLRPYRVPRPEIAALFNSTTPVTRITGPDNSVINHGIPPTRIAFLTGAPVERIPLANLHPNQPLPAQPASAPQFRPAARPAPQPPTRPNTGVLAAGQQENYPPNSLVVIGRQTHQTPQFPAAHSEYSSRQSQPSFLAETDNGSFQFTENQAEPTYPSFSESSGQFTGGQWPPNTLPTAYYNSSTAPSPGRTPSHTLLAAPESHVGGSQTLSQTSPGHQPPPQNHTLSDTLSHPPQPTQQAPPHQPPPDSHSRPELPPPPVQQQNHPAPEPPPPPRQAQPESHPTQPPPPPPTPAPAPPPQPSSSSSSHSGSDTRPR
jgi:hypothetical protein